MSRAFTKEDAPDAPVILADKAISEHPNYMTATGYLQIQSQRNDLESELASWSGDDSVSAKTREAELRRDLRYCNRRLETADVITPANPEVVRFGHHVEFVDDTGGTWCFQIVGEDEADIQLSKLSWTAPLAIELIGKAVGETAMWQKADQTFEINVLSIAQPRDTADQA